MPRAVARTGLGLIAVHGDRLDGHSGRARVRGSLYELESEFSTTVVFRRPNFTSAGVYDVDVLPAGLETTYVLQSTPLALHVYDVRSERIDPQSGPIVGGTLLTLRARGLVNCDTDIGATSKCGRFGVIQNLYT